jgi:UDP-N-acetylmuramyl pentapeptide phosphotransferase/UDP-N-acetylglucosamine-1-phosphate transferase
MLLAAFTAAAAGGFLVFNWQPARVFMGDVGSGFIGLVFAALPLVFLEQQRSVAFVPVILCLWPYIYDPLLSVLRRAWHRQNPFEPHREFLFHRLIRSGVSHSKTAMLYALLAGVGGILGFLMLNPLAPLPLRVGAPAIVVAMAAALTLGVERRCRQVGLPSAATKYSSALK